MIDKIQDATMAMLQRLFSILLVLTLLAGCAAPAAVESPPTAPGDTAEATAKPRVEAALATSEAPPPALVITLLAEAWQGGTDYILETRQDGLFVQANKVTTTAYMETIFPAIDLRQVPFASLTALSDISANIALGLVDANGSEGWIPGNSANREMAHGSHPLTHHFDFSRLNIDLSQITAVRVGCNRGGPVCRASFTISSILLGGEAKRGPNYFPLPDVDMVVGDEPLPVKAYPIGREDVGATWRAEFPPELVESGEFRREQFHYSLTGQPGSGTITLMAEKDSFSTRLSFQLRVTENQPPTMGEIPDQVMTIDTAAVLRLTEIDDGDPHSAQRLTLAASSQDPAVAFVEDIEHDGLNRWGTLTLRSAAAGITQITLTLTDDRGASAEYVFKVSVYPELNQPPDFWLPETLLVTTGGELRQEISDITAGEPNQKVTFSVETDTAEMAAQMEGKVLWLRPAPNFSGNAQVIITATDDGGNERNQGDAQTTHRVTVTVSQPAITGLVDTFDGPEVAPSLEGSGEGAHSLSIEDGVLRVDVDKYATNNQWAGLWYALPAELDLSHNPVITLRMKSDREAGMLIFLWDANDIYNTAGTVNFLVGTEWKEYTFDFSGKNLDSSGRELDFSRIKSLLINFAPGLLYQGTFWLDDLRVGTEANVQASAAPVQIEAPLQITMLPGAPLLERFPTSGLAETDRVELYGVDAAYFSAAELTRADEVIVLRLQSLPEATGFTRMKIIVSDGENTRTEKFLDIIIPDRNDTASVGVNRNIRLQTIDGFGAFLGSQEWNRQKQALNLPFVQDLGMTMARFGVIDNDFEPRNDNANPYVTDYSAFDLTAIPLDWMRRLKEESAIDKYILTVWSPPTWMKKGRTLAASTGSGENFLEERYYEEYAEFLTALVRVIKEHTDIDLYAISVQNEPQFNEPYASGLLDAEKMAQLLKVVALRFEAEGLDTKLFMPEALPQQKGIGEYIRQLDLVPEASQRTDIIAIHNYDSDGIHVGGAGAQEWADMYQWANAARPRRMWMTETSGHPDNWSGARLLFGNIYNALVHGNASAWVWWTLAETTANAQFGLVVDNRPTARYAISRHFYRAIQPGAVRVESLSDDGILSTAFENPDGSLVVVLFNTGKARLVSVKGMGQADEAWVSQDKLFSRPAPMLDGVILLPSDAAATLVYLPIKASE
jgi:O-glycosyl hydrolase